MNLTFEAFVLSSLSDDVTLEVDQNEHTEHLWSLPEELHKRPDLMTGLYPILEDVYKVNQS
jgi:hypothetical protein